MANNRLVNIVKIIEGDANLYKLFRFNEMTNRIEISNKDLWDNSINLTDLDVVQTKYYISNIYKDEYNVNLINEAICIVAQRLKYNPLKDYLKHLVWDKIPRLSRWLPEICGAEDNEYTSEVGTKILCAAVKRIFHPGCKFDYMLILEGGQGMGKSTLVSILGGQWYLDTSLSGQDNRKDLVDSMRTAWIIEISDLAGFRKSDVEYLKNFLSDQVDTVRLPYAKHNQDFPRQCVFIGTHNPSGDNQYFKDDTGNRRFWVVDCKKIDLAKAKEWRNQLFAEAVAKHHDMNLYLENKGSLLILNAMHKAREIETPLNEMIEDYIAGKNIVGNKDIIEKVFRQNPGQISFTELRSKCTVIGIHMRKLGWVRGENKKRGWYFKPGFEYAPIPIEELIDD